MMQHLNNATYATYFEFGRLHYLLEVVEGNIEAIGNVVASIKIDFLKPVLPISRPIIAVRCSRLGSKSFDFEYLISEESDVNTIYATGTTVQVCVDSKGNSTEMPSTLREKLLRYEENL